jgi:hypothetical protein
MFKNLRLTVKPDEYPFEKLRGKSQLQMPLTYREKNQTSLFGFLLFKKNQFVIYIYQHIQIVCI